MTQRTVLAFTLGLSLILSSAAFAQTKTKKNAEETYRLLNLFGDVFERVRASYVEQVSDEKLIESAITGMLSALDPHSSFMNSKNFKDMQVQTRGKFGGLGIEVTTENDLIKVVSPIDDTPAHRAGIQPNDLITHLDGKPVLGLNLSEAVGLMRGGVGTDIKLTIRREGREPFDVTITRAVIPIRSVRSRVEGNIGYMRISSFSAPTGRGIKREIKKIKDKLGDKLIGLVLDLRNNPGGLLDQAVAVSNAFLERGEVVSTRTRDKDQHQRFNAKKGDIIDGLPMVVLINGGSASASEIVAGALQDHKRAVILGTKSFGKGSVQTIIPLAQQRAMRLTTARYYTPSGRSIQAVGIDPDITVEQATIETVASRKRRRESDLRGALKNPGSNGNKATPAPAHGTTPNAAARPSDFQLQRALDLIRGVSFFTKRVKG